MGTEMERVGSARGILQRSLDVRILRVLTSQQPDQALEDGRK